MSDGGQGVGDGELHELSARQIAASVRSGAVSAEEVVSHHLERIEARRDLNAFITVDVDGALAAARAIRRPETAALAGVPFVPKDIFDTRGLRTTYGSAIFRDHIPDTTAPAVQRVVDAGAVIVGKANLNEFARGVTTQNPFFGDCANPARPGYSPGGSSGGNAAAVAAGLAAIGLATDAGGSSRAPAAACGVAGFKPSYGAVSLEGAFPLAAPFDHAGVIARSVDDCALLMEVLVGLPRPDDLGLDGLRVGLTHPVPRPDDLAATGMRLDEVSIPPFDDAIPVHLVEFAYSHRELYPARAGDYTPECRAMLDRGRAVSGLEYRVALDRLRDWRAQCEQSLDFDLLVSPTFLGDPPKLGEPETLDMLFRMSSLTRPYNLLGWPAAVTRDGLMFAGRSDAVVLGAAIAWEEQLSGSPTTW